MNESLAPIKLVIHIGAGKTGSSAIQDALARNARLLAERGILVPGNELTGPAIDGTQTSFFQGLFPPEEAGMKRVAERLRALAQQCRKRRLSTIVISAENLSTNPRFPELFAHIGDEFDTRIVLYVRRQDDFLIASWGQWQMKTEPDFGTWVRRVAGTRGNWNVVIQPWEAQFPRARIVVRVFDRQRLKGQDVIVDFMDALGESSDGLSRLPEANVNQSLNEIAIRVASRNRHLFMGLHDRRFTDFLREYGGSAAVRPINTGLYLTAAERRDLVARYAAANELLRRRHLPDLPEDGLFSTEFDDEPSVGFEELVTSELDLLWNAVYRLHEEAELSALGGAGGGRPGWTLDDVGEVGLAPPEE